MSVKPRRRKRRLVRLLLVAAAFVFGAPCLLFIFQEPILRRFVIPRIEQSLGAALGLDVTLGGVNVAPTGEALAWGFKASGPAPATGIRSASFSKVVVAFSPVGLLRGRSDWIESVRVEEPRIELDLSRDPLLPGGGGEAKAEPQATRGDLLLPRIEMRGAEIRLVTKVDALDLHGVNLDLDGHRVRLAVASAGGNWSPPRIVALEFPLELDVQLAGGGSSPWKDIRLDRLAMAGRECVRDFRVDLSDSKAVRLAGDLPGWGVKLTGGSVTIGGTGAPLLDLSFLAEDADLKPIVSVFTDWPCPEARCRGGFRLILPIGREADWRVETDMELSRVAWKEQSLSAELVRIVGGRGGEGLVLRGDVVVAGLEWSGLPPVDLTGRFRREGDTNPVGGYRIVLDEVVVRSGAAEAEVSAVLHESGLRVEHGSLRAQRFPIAELARGGALPVGLQSSDAEVTVDAFFHGAAGDPSTWDAVALLRATALRGDSGDPQASLSVEPMLGACQLRINDGMLRRCEDEIRFALAADASGFDLPVRVVFERFDGRVLGFALDAVEPPVFVHGEDGFRLEPMLLHALGGTVSAAASEDALGETSAFVSVDGASLALFTSARPAIAPTGVVSLSASFSSVNGSGVEGPVLDVEASLHRAAATVAGERLEGLEGDLKAGITRDALKLNRLELSRGADSVSLSGSVPVSWDPLPLPRAGEAFGVKLRADLADAGSLPGAKSVFRDVGGRVVATGEVRGIVAANPHDVLRTLDVSALVKVDGGRIKQYEELPPISDLAGEIRISNGTISIETLAGKMRDAGFTIAGGIEADLPWTSETFAVRDIDLKLRSTGALLLRRPDLRVRGDLDLRWHGPWGASSLDGDVVVTRAYYLEDISLSPSRGARLPLKLFSLKEAPLDSMRFSLKVRSDRGIILRNNIVSTRASAQLFLGGTGLEPVLAGTISTDEGTVSFADSSLKLRNSFVELLPNDPLNPRLQIVLGETIRGYAVTLSITGSLEQPEVLLDSSPPLEREKVLVLITTGLTLEELEDRGVSRVAAVKAAKYVGLRLARYLSRGDPTDKSFFDRISLETESAKSVGYEDPIRVEIRLIEGLVKQSDELFLQGERDQYGDYNFNFGLRFELD